MGTSPRKVPVFFPSPQKSKSSRDLNKSEKDLLTSKPQFGLHVADLWSQRQQLEFRKVMRAQHVQLVKEQQARLMRSLATSRKRPTQQQYLSLSPVASPTRRPEFPPSLKQLGKRQQLDYLITDCDSALRSFRRMESPHHSPTSSRLLSDLMSESAISLKLVGKKHYTRRNKPWHLII